MRGRDAPIESTTGWQLKLDPVDKGPPKALFSVGRREKRRNEGNGLSRGEFCLQFESVFLLFSAVSPTCSNGMANPLNAYYTGHGEMSVK